MARSLLAQTRASLQTAAHIAVTGAVTTLGRLLTRTGTALLLYPHRKEQIEIPAATAVNGHPVDVVKDLVDYTGLERAQVEALVQRRYESFRTEWHALPGQLRNEPWFYLSSRTYLFGNAVHDVEDLADAIAAFLPGPSDVLDFGGGTGNLALALAARGHRVAFVERSALQVDFVRFRVEKHGLVGAIRVLDHWRPLEQHAYDLVCAFDVLEHIDELEETLLRVLTAPRPGGLLAESSPFVRSTANPMHHEGEADFLRFMRQAGFRCVHDDPRFRLWRAPRR